MVKRYLMVGLLLVIVSLSGSLLYAAEETATTPNYTWTKVGDRVYYVWDLNEFFLVEYTKEYRPPAVKVLTSTGEVKEAMDRFFFTNIKYDNEYVLSVKGIRDQDKVWITNMEESLFILRSQYSNYHFFVDNVLSGSIWGIQPEVTDTVRFKVTKLTKDTVNGKTLAQIRVDAGLNEEQLVYWVNDPVISPGDKYIAYDSNKRLKGFELWLIDLKKGTDQPLFGVSGKDLSVLTWTDNHTLLYSMDNKYYLYDLNSRSSKVFVKDIQLLGYRSGLGLYVYYKNTDTKQLYIYRKKVNQEIKLPKLPTGVTISSTLSGSDYVPAPDGSKLLIRATVRDPKRRDVIYLLDPKTNFCGEIPCPKDERPCFIDKWFNDKTVIIRANSDRIIEGTNNMIAVETTWVLTFQNL